MSLDQLWQHSATEQAALVRSGQTSARELVQAHLDRIATVNGAVNAVTAVLAETALVAADAADAATARGDVRGPLHGVPFTIKENIDVAGSATTEGVPALADSIAEFDAPTVARLRAAGAIPLARTNLPDLGMRMHTDSGLHGLTRNPWAPGRTAGGSSGGEAAAIATGMSPLGLGTDIGGSLRSPAYCCGITSLKPSFGRVPRASAVAPTFSMVTAQYMAAFGPMARRVEDLSVALDLIAGPHPWDPYTFPSPPRVDLADHQLRVAVVASPPGGTTHPTVLAAVARAAAALASAGHSVTEETPPQWEDAVDVWRLWLGGETELLRPMFDPILSADAKRYLDLHVEAWPGSRDPLASQLLSRRHLIARAWSEFFARFDVVLCPVWTEPPFANGYDILGVEEHSVVSALVRAVLPANLLGLPAAAVPVSVADGLPVGVQLIGDRFREDLCLAAAAVIEQAVGILTPIDPRLAVAGAEVAASR